MVDKLIPKGNWFWNFVGFGLMWFLIGSGWSIARAANYQIELMEYKLAVGNVLSSVGKVSNTLEITAETSAIAPAQKQKIQQLTQKSDRTIDAIEKDIEKSTAKIIKSEIKE